MYDDILLACDFYISFHSLSLFFSNWGGLDIYSTFHANFCSFLTFHEFESTDISTPQQLPARAAMFTASWVLVQLRLTLLVCDRSVSVNVITHTFVGPKCLTETKIQILCDHVSHTRLHIVEMGCQMVQLLSAHIVGPTMCVNLTPSFWSQGGRFDPVSSKNYIIDSF